jgi:hypothetical protein
VVDKSCAELVAEFSRRFEKGIFFAPPEFGGF